MNIKEGKVTKGGRNTPPITERPSKPEGQQPQQPQYPECEKMQKVQKESQSIGEFLEWLSSKKGLTICKWFDDEKGDGDLIGGYYPEHLSIEQWLAEFFEIDLNKVEKEKRSIIEDIRRKDENNNQV